MITIIKQNDKYCSFYRKIKFWIRSCFFFIYILNLTDYSGEICIKAPLPATLLNCLCSRKNFKLLSGAGIFWLFWSWTHIFNQWEYFMPFCPEKWPRQLKKDEITFFHPLPCRPFEQDKPANMTEHTFSSFAS